MKGLSLLLAALLLTACSPTTESGDDPVTVFAAASLQQVFPELSRQAGIEANFSFDGSSGLVDQIHGGAPADVFASADQRTMNRAVELGLIDKAPQMFATNVLVLVVSAGNPGGVTGLDSSLDHAKLVVCAPEVPCGGATVALAEKQGVTLHPVSEESKVTDVVGKVASGEADAGLVYATDAASAGEAVEVIEILGADEDPNTYWIAVVKDAPHPEAASRFVAAVLNGVDTLAGFGFGPAQA